MTEAADWSDLYRPRVAIGDRTRVATAGSCFAQHIGRALREAGCRVLDAEPAPPLMTPAVARRFNYGVYSARYGNVYTARQLLQLLADAAEPGAEPRHVWVLEDGFVDAFRPTIEPVPLASVEEVMLHRFVHLTRLAAMLMECQVFVFTLGLTEAWMDRKTERVFPVCPGIAGGQFDGDAHMLRTFTHADVLADLRAIRDLLHRFNPAMQLLLTVSPVPLTATAGEDHVMTATAQAKATLRAAAGEFVSETSGTDYFPSFEIVTSPAQGGPWFAANLRSVNDAGVRRVMNTFLAAQGLAPGDGPAPAATRPPAEDADDLVCDDLLLQSFAR